MNVVPLAKLWREEIYSVFVANLLATQLQQAMPTNPRMPSCPIVSSRSSV